MGRGAVRHGRAEWWLIFGVGRTGGPTSGLRHEVVVDLLRGAQGQSSVGTAEQGRSGIHCLFKRGRGSGA